jgi:dienelactone hydrolase
MSASAAKCRCDASTLARRHVLRLPRVSIPTAFVALLFTVGAWQANRDVCPGCETSDIFLALADGTPIHTRLYLPPAAQLNIPAVIVCHGYLANLAFVEIPWAADLTRLGFAALFVDRRGHGTSGGTVWPRRRSDKLDEWEPELAAAIGYLRGSSPVIDPNRIALLGHSDGATAALIAASADWDVRATVAVSASVGPLEFVNHVAPQNLLLVYGAEDRFVLGQTDRLLIARGTRGYLDGPGSTGEFGDGSARRLVRVPGRGHLDVFYSDEARLRILTWLRDSLERPSPRRSGSGAGTPNEAAGIQLSPHRSVWLSSGAAAILLALLFPFFKTGASAFGGDSGLVGMANGRGPNCLGETYQGEEFRYRNLAGLTARRKSRPATSVVIPANAGIQFFRIFLDPRFRGGDEGRPFFRTLLSRCIALAALWAAGLCLAPWLSQQVQTVPGQEGPVLAALLLAPGVTLWLGCAALVVLNKVCARPAAPTAILSGGGRQSYANVFSRALRGAARGALISGLLFAAARVLLLHHYDIGLSVPRLAILVVFSGAALPAFAALECWLQRLATEAWWYAPACEALLSFVTAILSGQLFERMSMAPGYLLAAALVVAAAHRIGTRSFDPVASAAVGAFTVAWMGAVGAALY